MLHQNYISTTLLPTKALLILCVLALFTSCTKDSPEDEFSLNEIDQQLKNSLNEHGGITAFLMPSSNNYAEIPQDPKNKITSQKVALGKRLFFETGLAKNAAMNEGTETYSCASCHVAGAAFQAGIRQGIGDGGQGFGISGEARIPNANYPEEWLDIPHIRVPNNLNTAYITNAAWDGKLGATHANIGTESRWNEEDIFLRTNHLGYMGVETQAIAGLEFHRLVMDSNLIKSTYYKDLFDLAFPEFPVSERYTFETGGLAIAAYERTMLTNQAPFQKWLGGEYQAMTDKQKQGALLFFGKAACVNCHSGPALNGNEFHAIGMNDMTGNGVLGSFSEEDVALGRGGFTGVAEDNYKYKVPQIYGLKDARFLGHGGTFTSIRNIIEYKNLAIAENDIVPTSQLSPFFQPLSLSTEELDLLQDFLENALYDENIKRYQAESVASGNCFPNNDAQSQSDMGCN